MMFKAVLFDLDGTLLDTAPDFTRILNQLLQTHGRPPVPHAEVRRIVSSGARALISLGFNIGEEDERFHGYLDELLKMYDNHIRETRCAPFEGADRLIRRLEQSALVWGIVTNKPSRFTLPLLERTELLRDCRIVVCRDHVEAAKPDPAGLLLACRQAGCAPEQAVYIGDHPKDIEAGKKAGVATVAAAWGYLPDGPDITQWDADLIARSMEDLEHYFFHTGRFAHV